MCRSIPLTLNRLGPLPRRIGLSRLGAAPSGYHSGNPGKTNPPVLPLVQRPVAGKLQAVNEPNSTADSTAQSPGKPGSNEAVRKGLVIFGPLRDREASWGMGRRRTGGVWKGRSCGVLGTAAGACGSSGAPVAGVAGFNVQDWGWRRRWLPEEYGRGGGNLDSSRGSG
jgi:hypothetical protein